MITNATRKLTQQRNEILSQMTESIRLFMAAEQSLKAPESMELFQQLFTEQQAALIHHSALIARQAADRSEYQKQTKALLKWKYRAKAACKQRDELQREVKRLNEFGGDMIQQNLDKELEICDLMEDIEDLKEITSSRADALCQTITQREQQIIALQAQNQRLQDEVSDQEAVINRLNQSSTPDMATEDSLTKAYGVALEQISDLEDNLAHGRVCIRKLEEQLQHETNSNNLYRQALETERQTNKVLSLKLADQAEALAELTEDQAERHAQQKAKIERHRDNVVDEVGYALPVTEVLRGVA